MSLDIIEKMRDEMINAGIREWLISLGLDKTKIDAIFKGST